MTESLRGTLLVASPSILDPNFARTVVLIAEHTDDGAMGLVLNRVAEATVGEVVPGLAELAGEESVLTMGGPVLPQSVVILAEFDDLDQAAVLAFEDVGLPRPDTELDSLALAVRRVRIFAGHAGWGPGQLEDELAREDWILEPALREEVFGEDPEGLWSAVLERKGGHYRLIARMPADPSMN